MRRRNDLVRCPVLVCAAALALGLEAACAAQPEINADASSTSTSNDGGNGSDTTGEATTSDGQSTTETADPFECVTTADCFNLSHCLECIDNTCQSPPSACEDDFECAQFSACENVDGCGLCVPQGTPPPHCPDDLVTRPRTLDPGALPIGLGFANVDANGGAELVVVTTTEFRLFEFGSDVPNVTPRAQGSLMTDDVIVGEFDGQPGDDLLLLVDGELHRYFADGVSGFINPIIEPMVQPYPRRLIAGDFDGQDLDDLLFDRSDDSVTLEFDGGGTTIPLDVQSNDLYSHYAVFEFGAAHPGLLAVINSHAYSFDFAGNLVADGDSDPANDLLAVRSSDGGAYFRVIIEEITLGNNFLRLTAIDPLTAVEGIELAAAGYYVTVGDLDGDQYDELITNSGFQPTIIFDPLGEPCYNIAGFGQELAEVPFFAVGDHDGDGDDEVAVTAASNDIAIVDGE